MRTDRQAYIVSFHSFFFSFFNARTYILRGVARFLSISLTCYSVINSFEKILQSARPDVTEQWSSPEIFAAAHREKWAIKSLYSLQCYRIFFHNGHERVRRKLDRSTCEAWWKLIFRHCPKFPVIPVFLPRPLDRDTRVSIWEKINFSWFINYSWYLYA